MKKGDKQIRIGNNVFTVKPESYAIVQEHKHLHGFKKDGEALESLIKEAWHTRMYLQYFLTHRDATKEDPYCIRRMFWDGEFYCCKNAPHVYVLPTLDICVCCRWKVILKQWTARALEHPSASTATSLNTQDIPKQKIPLSEIYCPQNTCMVIKSACDNCKKECQKRELWNT